MRVLVLDDEQYRHDGFAKRFAGEDVTHVRTAPEAIEALGGVRYDLATLDHDLGYGNGNGRDVAEHIASMPQATRPRFVVVHSYNPPAADLMVAILKQARVPSHSRPYGFDGEAAE